MLERSVYLVLKWGKPPKTQQLRTWVPSSSFPMKPKVGWLPRWLVVSNLPNALGHNGEKWPQTEGWNEISFLMVQWPCSGSQPACPWNLRLSSSKSDIITQPLNSSSFNKASGQDACFPHRKLDPWPCRSQGQLLTTCPSFSICVCGFVGRGLLCWNRNTHLFLLIFQLVLDFST